MPRHDNAIYQLAAALLRISNYSFPVELNEVTRTYLERTGKISQGPVAAAMLALAKDPGDTKAVAGLAADPRTNAMLHTTCVATRLAAGHADNALPQTATALVNCRLLPEDSPDKIMTTLAAVIADPSVSIRAVKPARIGPPSPLTPQFMKAAVESNGGTLAGSAGDSYDVYRSYR